MALQIVRAATHERVLVLQAAAVAQLDQDMA
jgi:hypothetical protein